MDNTYLPDAMPIPVPSSDGLEEPFWAGLREERVRIQRCDACATWIFGPEWICHACRSFDLTWTDVEPTGVVYSWTRVWHPVSAALAGHGPYVAVVVELPQAGAVRLIGNLLGDPLRPVEIGARVRGVFEHHVARTPAPATGGGGYGTPAVSAPATDVASGYTLLHWERCS